MALINANSKGVYVIGVTPFEDNGAIDFESLDRVVDFYYEKGADGLTILGMMGEAPKLTQAESVEVTRRVLRRSGQKPVVVGVSAPGLAALGELSKIVMDLGAAGVMVAPPSILRTDEQVTNYYRNVVETLGPDVPVVLQDFPLATSVQISSKTLNAIFEAHPSIVMLKHEDWPGLQKVTDLRLAEAQGRRRISILCGNAGIFLPEEMQRGADGAMTGFAFPEMMVNVVRLSEEGKFSEAHDVFDAYLPLMRYEQQPGLGLAVRKYVLQKRGAIASSSQRRPGLTLSDTAKREVDRLLERQEKNLSLLR
ncbi:MULTISPECIES: dihydrodipicolinate synthase family protein [unclassified Klebsiella]|uniref:dihydrodipicolinate synthase family protein n=1 Tax=unclassified Klebsiella TaxID=2608929 RepID=UPI000C2B38D5|nr:MULTISPECIES: dihydrodipicolinate synthase family protein [unclassified Klebsiella]PJX55972.1 dihydrodipicolinate synthase family protein [Klebsiella sp. F-Nf9]PKJ69889.1 dihydrodipicolinate synthase family protein [Klebsiella sp. X1-16S-Nf21]